MLALPTLLLSHSTCQKASLENGMTQIKCKVPQANWSLPYLGEPDSVYPDLSSTVSEVSCSWSPYMACILQKAPSAPFQ